MIRLSIPADAGQDVGWLTDPAKRASVGLAINLVPFAGIAFLWFIGVIRDRIGAHEDRFFATVLLGSGLLFVAMLFVASAPSPRACGWRRRAPARSRRRTDAWRIDARITALLLNVYAMRMAAVFTISVATISLRTGVIPKWLAYLGLRERPRPPGHLRHLAVGPAAVPAVDPAPQRPHPAAIVDGHTSSQRGVGVSPPRGRGASDRGRP